MSHDVLFRVRMVPGGDYHKKTAVTESLYLSGGFAISFMVLS